MYKTCSPRIMKLSFPLSFLATLFMAAHHVVARKTSMLIDSAALPILPTVPQADAAAADAGLNLTDIQGDILIGMKKNKELFFFFNITDTATFKAKLGSAILPLITTTTQLLDVTTQPTTAVNIAFSHAGLLVLGNTDNVSDAPFARGQLSASSTLGDPGTSNYVPTLAFSNGVLLLASDTVVNIDAQLSQIQTALGSSISETYRLSGAARPGAEQGHEHFGYSDGVSQPKIIGFSDSIVDKNRAVAAGVILVGETGDGMVSTRPAWTKDGSFLAFRQLKQLVPEFNKFLLDNAITGNNLSQEDGAALLGARMIGRWKSGAPVDLSPDADNASLGSDPSQNNNFDYTDAATGSIDDQTRCPFAAHTRKTNPRAGLPPFTLDFHRIMRAGIPYGPEVTAAESASNTSDPSLERGLAFVSYQSSIDSGFATIQTAWSDSTFFGGAASERTPGFDPIIGGNHGLPRNMTGIYPDNIKAQLTMFDFIVSRGGEYFFSPSLSAIQDTLSV